MSERAELVEAALEVYREGLAVLDGDDRVVFWNRAAEVMTGYPGAQVLGKQLPGSLVGLTSCQGEGDSGNGSPVHATVVHAQHQHGYDLPAVARRLVLRNGLTERIGTAVVFHCGEQIVALPRAIGCDGLDVKQSQADVQERLEMEYQASLHGGGPLGILWIAVDQACELRKTHGMRACEAMMDSVERTLSNSLLGGEEIGRWGDDEFLVMAREGGGELWFDRARSLTGVTRTADFRWWGDRISVTASAGLAIAEVDENLPGLLERARLAMETSVHAGGNQVTVAPGRRG